MRFLSSAQNPEIKTVARLKDRRDREREGQYLIEGTRELARALAGGVPVETVYACDDLLRPEGHALLSTLQEVEVVRVSEAAFGRLSMRENPDGLVSVARITARSLPDPEDAALVLVLVGIEKPGNLGALLRTADGVGVDGVIIAGRGVDLHNPNVIRASQGSVFTLPVVAWDDEQALAYLREQHYRLFAVTPEGAVNYWSANYAGRCALVLGTEHEGLAQHWKDAASERVSIPMRGAADSLNVATAGALVLYEALRQREGT